MIRRYIALAGAVALTAILVPSAALAAPAGASPDVTGPIIQTNTGYSLLDNGAGVAVTEEDSGNNWTNIDGTTIDGHQFYQYQDGVGNCLQMATNGEVVSTGGCVKGLDRQQFWYDDGHALVPAQNLTYALVGGANLGSEVSIIDLNGCNSGNFCFWSVG
jgi:hypothetical protein